MKTSGFMALVLGLFVLTTAAAAGGMYQGVSGGPSMSYSGVSGSIDGIFASYPHQPSTFPCPLFMDGEEFCQLVATHLSNPHTAWDW